MRTLYLAWQAPDPVRAERLQVDELLQVALELNNPAAGAAVQLQSRDDYQMIGWAPRYLVGDLLKAMAEHPAYRPR